MLLSVFQTYNYLITGHEEREFQSTGIQNSKFISNGKHTTAYEQNDRNCVINYKVYYKKLKLLFVFIRVSDNLSIFSLVSQCVFFV